MTKKCDARVDYRYCVTMPIRDMQRDGKIVFLVDVYGVTPKDLAVVGDPDDPYIVGAKPLIKAVRRLGLDPHRYQAVLWDIPV